MSEGTPGVADGAEGGDSSVSCPGGTGTGRGTAPWRSQQLLSLLWALLAVPRSRRVLGELEKRWLHPTGAVAPLSPPPRVAIVTLVPSPLTVSSLGEHGLAHPTKGLLGHFWDQRGAGMMLWRLWETPGSPLFPALPARPGATTAVSHGCDKPRPPLWQPALLPPCRGCHRSWRFPLCRGQSQRAQADGRIGSCHPGDTREQPLALPTVTGMGTRRG